MSSVYLLHIYPPYQGKKHYIGFTRDAHPARRVAQHNSGRGGDFTGRAYKTGSRFTLVLFWSGPTANEKFERYLKDGMDTKCWCPVCGLNTKPIPKLTDYSCEEASIRRENVLKRNDKPWKKRNKNLDQTVDDMIRNSYGERSWDS